MSIVSAAIIVVLASVGLAAIFKEISLRLFSCKDECTVMYVTHIPGDCENIEFVLRSVLAKRRWSNEKNTVRAICVSCTLDEKTRKICEGVCREYGFENLLTKDEFLKSLD